MSIVTQILFWLVVWFLVSIPLAIVVGKQLRKVRRAQTRQYEGPGANRRKHSQRPTAAADPRSHLRRGDKRRAVAAR